MSRRSPVFDPSLESALFHAAEMGCASECSLLLEPGADPMSRDGYALWASAICGSAECVKLFAPLSTSKRFTFDALWIAARNGHAECVRLLIPASNPSDEDAKALRMAAEEGHAECVKLLIPASGLRGISLAIRHAASSGRVECMDICLNAASRLPKPEWDKLLLCLLERGIIHRQARVVALVLSKNPDLADLLDLPSMRTQALAQDDKALAEALDSLLERSALENATSQPAARRPSRM